jgi:hypothetical protein
VGDLGNEGEVRLYGLICLRVFFFILISFCKGDSYPEICTAEGGGFLLSELTGRGPEAGSLCIS